MDWTTLVWAVMPSLIVSVFMACFNRRQKKRDEELDKRAAARKRESLLALDLQMATAKMAFATAVAIKRGKTNGEVEEGIEAYEDARKKYLSFLNEQATDHLAQ